MSPSPLTRLAIVVTASVAVAFSAAAVAPVTAGAALPMVLTLVWNRNMPGVTFRESSPVVANLGRPAYVVGGLDGRLYALDAGTGANLAGFPAATSNPINSSAAAADVTGSGNDQLFVGSGYGDAGPCSGGGVYSFDAAGHQRWRAPGGDPGCGNLAFHATPAIGDINGDGVPDVTLGALGLNAYSFSAASGGLDGGWPAYTDDTVYSSAALADLNGTGLPQVIMGGDSSSGGPIDHRGGLVRSLSGDGHVNWQFFTDEIVRSSPAVGDIDGSGHPSVVFGTGDYWLTHGGSSDNSKVFALDGGGHLKWSRDLGGVTMSSPALADIGGTGHADVVIGTAEGANPGKIWVLDGHGNPLPNWNGHPSGGGVVIGGIATADLNGDGAQDLVVPTGAGIFAYDGRTGGLLFQLDTGLVSFQSTPLLTNDGFGTVGITVAGTTPGGVGVVQHWRTTPGASLGNLGWPMFHHDARRTGNLVVPPISVQLCPAGGADPAATGYWFVAHDGGVFSYCSARFHGSAAGMARAPVVAVTSTPSGQGYWIAGADGAVFAFGDAVSHGSVAGLPLSSPIVGMARTASGKGYWLVASDGGVFNFGEAQFHGSTGALHLNSPIVSLAPTPTGGGYWLVAADGGVFAFGDTRFLGSTGGAHLNSPVVGMKRTPSGNGYWMVSRDGGVFPFGDAGFFGSVGGLHLNQPIVNMTPTADGRGYWLVASDGGIFSFGDARFLGSTGAITLNQPITAMAAPGT